MCAVCVAESTSGRACTFAYRSHFLLSPAAVPLHPPLLFGALHMWCRAPRRQWQDFNPDYLYGLVLLVSLSREVSPSALVVVPL